MAPIEQLFFLIVKIIKCLTNTQFIIKINKPIVEEKALPLITLEGIDKSGKATQALLLARKLEKKEVKVEIIAFPDYSTIVGKTIKTYLDGRINLCPEIRQLLYVANRWEKKNELRLWLKEGKTVIADRYIPSGLVYGLANGLDLDWMINLEKGLPPSDLVIVLDISVATAFDRDNIRDVYEKNESFLKKVRKSYFILAKKFGWFIVNGENSKEEVAKQIWAHTSKFV